MPCVFRPAIFAASLAVSAAAYAGPAYTALDLGAIPNSIDRSQAFDLNNTAQVVGSSSATNSSRAILWTTPSAAPPASPTMTDLGTLVDMQNAQASSINTRGQIVGSSNNNGDRVRAFLWNPAAPNSTTGSMVELTNLPGERNRGRALGINAAGQVVGLSGTRAFLWTPTVPNGATGAAIDLGDLPGGVDSSFAFGVNAAGQAVGVSAAAAGNRAFLWTPNAPNGNAGAMLDLGSLVPGGMSTGAAINNAGQVAGTSDTTSTPTTGSQHAFRWTHTPGAAPAVGDMIDLGDLPGGNDLSFAQGLNEAGQVVGVSNSAGSDHAFLWSQADGMLDLNALLDQYSAADWVLSSAAAINDAGQIAGFGMFDPDGPAEAFAPAIHAFLLTPLPPASADFNADGRVDDADLAAWRMGFGAPNALASQGDADHDRDVDGNDFLIWQCQLAVAPPGATAVPEPQSWHQMLLFCVALTLIDRLGPGRSLRQRR